MDTSFIFLNCYTGTDFENLVMDILNENGFTAKKTGSNDGGIDIVAESTTKPKTYTFNIQCKFFNRPLSKAPIQEVFSGTHYYGNGGRPVVITNNRVTTEARVYAKRLGVEIIGDAECCCSSRSMRDEAIRTDARSRSVITIAIVVSPFGATHADVQAESVHVFIIYNHYI